MGVQISVRKGVLFAGLMVAGAKAAFKGAVMFNMVIVCRWRR